MRVYSKYKGNNYILHLASWYPGKNQDFTATFIRDQIHALSEIKKSVLITIIEEKNRTNIEFEENNYPNLIEIIVYIPLKGLFLRWVFYFYYYWKNIKRILSRFGKPEVVHVHVAYKASALAVFLSLCYDIPFLITEHFSVFQPSSTQKNKPFILWYSKLLSQKAKKIIAVSHSLRNNLMLYGFKNVYVVPNPVNTNIFTYKAIAPQRTKRFLHVSNLKESQKNVKGILEAFEKVYGKYVDSELKIISSDSNELIKLQQFVSKRYSHLPIIFSQGISHLELADEMNRAFALVMFSNFETFSLVVAEALCCGLPCVASKCGGPEELINESNGIIVQNGNIDELVSGLLKISSYKFDREKISRDAQMKYSFEVFRIEYFNMYSSVCPMHINSNL